MSANKRQIYGDGVTPAPDHVLRKRKNIGRQFVYRAKLSPAQVADALHECEVEDLHYITVSVLVPPKHHKKPPMVVGLIKTSGWHHTDEIRRKLVADGAVSVVSRKSTRCLIGRPFAIIYADPESGYKADLEDIYKLINN